VPYCQKYTPTDSFFGDSAHWDRAKKNRENIKNHFWTFEAQS